MRKLKLYLDTSVISHLFADDAPDKKEETQKLWDSLIAGEYEVYVSDTVFSEISKCKEPRQSQIIDALEKIKYVHLQSSDEVENLTSEYINNGLLSPSSINDCQHIAYAVVTRCDAIVSWNFKHLVNFRTNNKVRIINAIINYQEISIVSPIMINENKGDI